MTGPRQIDDPRIGHTSLEVLGGAFGVRHERAVECLDRGALLLVLRLIVVGQRRIDADDSRTLGQHDVWAGRYPADAPPYPGLVPPPPVPVKPPRPKSRLGGVVVSLACVALGILALVDISGGAVSGGAYVATALAVVGLGLVVGAWMGRARWLILPGVLLTLALIGNSVAASGPWPNPMRPGSTGNLTWSPTTPDSVDRNYRLDAGNGTLDLSHVDFTDHSVDVELSTNVGDLVVILPPKVDVDVDAKVSFGDGQVFDEQWNGIDKSRRHISDNGTDGPGGGHLHLVANVDVGKLEVHR